MDLYLEPQRPYDGIMLNRRMMIELAVAGLSQAVLLEAEPAQGTGQVKPVFQQALPNLERKDWAVTAVEVHYNAGEASHAHQHAGFVVGYVLEGEIRFQLRGQPEKTFRAGEMFFEPPGSVHQVSANASSSKPARLLALIFAEQGAQLTEPA
jgi:quercetin dioxygenase-like cupin family protein